MTVYGLIISALALVSSNVSLNAPACIVSAFSRNLPARSTYLYADEYFLAINILLSNVDNVPTTRFGFV